MTATTAEREALIHSLTGLVGRTRAMREELEAYAREIVPAAQGEAHGRMVLLAFGAVVGDQDEAGRLDSLEAAARVLLRSLVGEGPGGRIGGTRPLPPARARAALPAAWGEERESDAR